MCTLVCEHRSQLSSAAGGRWIREEINSLVQQTSSVKTQQSLILCRFGSVSFSIFLAGDRENVAEASAVMLSCLQWLHHPSGNRSQLGVSSQSAQMLNGMTGCVQALRPRPNRRWLLDGDTRQPQDTRWTRHSEQLYTPAEAAASDAAGWLKRGLRWMTPWRTASRR